MISGFSILKNGEKLGYPWRESLLSLAPLVDEIVLALGDCQDGTPLALESLRTQLSCPLRIIDSPWDAQNTKNGSELARQSNIALAHCKYPLCFYLQGDEVLNEAEAPQIREDIKKMGEDESLDGLAFQWIHFYGNYDHIVESQRWYRREVRVIKKQRGLLSYGDAQGFRIPQNQGWKKPRVALSSAHVHHYGWVRPPILMAQKTESLDRLWHGTQRDGAHTAESIYPLQFGIKKYTGQHPLAMKHRIESSPDYPLFQNKQLKKDRKYWKLALNAWIENKSGHRIGEYKNYRLIKKF